MTTLLTTHLLNRHGWEDYCAAGVTHRTLPLQGTLVARNTRQGIAVLRTADGQDHIVHVDWVKVPVRARQAVRKGPAKLSRTQQVIQELLREKAQHG